MLTAMAIHIRTIIIAMTFFVGILPAISFGQAQCNQAHRSFKFTTLQEYLNVRTSQKYPELAFVVNDPDHFFETMKMRFNIQKKISPENPHAFDYSELGIPALQYMKKKGLLNQVMIWGLADLIPKLHVYVGIEKKELIVAMEFAQKLLREIDYFLEKGSVSYSDLLRLSFFYTRLTSFNHELYHTPLQELQLAFDRKLEGYKRLSIYEEYELYKTNELHVFQPGQTASIRDYRLAQDPFVKAVTDKQELGAIIIPTAVSLESDIFLRLLSRHNIHLSGLTHSNLQADGFLRPSGDFWNHDLRHEAAKFMEMKLYLQKHKINEEQAAILRLQMDKWMAQLDAFIYKIKDPALQDAAKLVRFNVHHDSGYPLTPSAFLGQSRLSKTILFYISLVVGMERQSFFDGIRNIVKARSLIKSFWEQRLHEEQKLLASFKEEMN